MGACAVILFWVLLWFRPGPPYQMSTTPTNVSSIWDFRAYRGPRVWADDPIKLATIKLPDRRRRPRKETVEDVVNQGVVDMISFHNVIARGFNSIYQQAGYVTAENQPGFIVYALTW